MAGPYKGAPLSLVTVVPAVSGPFDLGIALVRAAVNVNPVTAQVTTVADPLPQILGGIPLRIRSIRIELDRPGFTLNPTDCDPMATVGRVLGSEGANAAFSSHFQVGNCADLPYGPKLSLRLSGGLNRLGHPAIHAVLQAKPGEANSRRISVTLPKGELLDNGHIRNICTRVDFARDACPAGSLIGEVEATTPLLDQPLTGSVFLRSSDHELPDLALDLEGQFDIEALGRIDSSKGRLRTTFETVPDVPITRITLDLLGGNKGLLQNSADLCLGKPRRAEVRMTGQNEAVVRSRPRLKVSCGAAEQRRRSANKRKSG